MKGIIPKAHTSKLIIIALIVISCSAFYTYQIIDKPKSAPENIGIESSEENPHFSVSWMGYAPTYDNQFPEYSICINNLADSTLQTQIALEIKNQEDSAYFFVVDQYTAPPGGWTITPMALGQIAVDETLQFVFDGASRTKPTSIAGGRLTETITLVVKAYYDAGYSNLYSQDDFTVTFNFLDYTSGTWNIILHDDFDDGTIQGWSSYGFGSGASTSLVGASNDYYRSFQYSLKLQARSLSQQSYWCKSAFRKSINIGLVSEAYLIYSIRSEDWAGLNYQGSEKLGVDINGVKYFGIDSIPNTNVWYQFAIPLKIGETNIVDVYAVYTQGYNSYSYAYLDDIYVITKP